MTKPPANRKTPGTVYPLAIRQRLGKASLTIKFYDDPPDLLYVELLRFLFPGDNAFLLSSAQVIGQQNIYGHCEYRQDDCPDSVTHRQLTWARNSATALGPANAEFNAGDEVKANARPRFLKFVISVRLRAHPSYTQDLQNQQNRRPRFVSANLQW